MSEIVMSTLSTPAPRSTSGVEPRRWQLAGPAWRLARLVTRSRADRLLRLRPEAILPRVARPRLQAMGLPDDAIDATLRDVRSLAAWAGAWTHTAQRYLGDARRHHGEGRWVEAAVARQRAALCYHVAQFVVDDPRTARALRASATSLFAQTLSELMAGASRVEVAWRTRSLPGYLLLPATATPPLPLAVLLNGSTTAKEETCRWAGPFLDQGLAVLALDTPGTGEASEMAPFTADVDDITEGVFALAAAEPRLDAARVALVGVSLGGALAVRAAAFDRRVAACVAVTPPYDARAWLDHACPLAKDQLAGRCPDGAEIAELAAGFALPDIVRKVRCPTLVLGAGRDLIVPPDEAVRLAAALDWLGTLLWFPRGAHALYDSVPIWTDDVARWLLLILGREGWPPASTRVDEGTRELTPATADAAGVSAR